MSYINHFGEESEQYLKYRPQYPISLFDYLTSIVKVHGLALDCGTGNGQAAVALSSKFTKVIATDINESQLKAAPKRDNIEYYCTASENIPVKSTSIDLITVAQALHWFNFENFYTEVKRVAKPQCIIACWCYSLCTISPEIDQIVLMLYKDILGDKYWPAERKYIDEKYQTIPFPFKKMNCPDFNIKMEYHFADLVGYLNTWSAVKEYKKHHQKSPLEIIYPSLASAWGAVDSIKLVQWPIHLLVGNVFDN